MPDNMAGKYDESSANRVQHFATQWTHHWVCSRTHTRQSCTLLVRYCQVEHRFCFITNVQKIFILSSNTRTSYRHNHSRLCVEHAEYVDCFTTDCASVSERVPPAYSFAFLITITYWRCGRRILRVRRVDDDGMFSPGRRINFHAGSPVSYN